MAQTRIILVGLGPGSPDALTVGALRTLRDAGNIPIYLRTRIHPTVEWLEREEGIRFHASFDDRYETAATFEEVYASIAKRLVEVATANGAVIYALPGHPLVGEKSVALLLERAKAKGIAVEIVAAVSFIETVLASAAVEVSQIDVIDALDVPDLQNPYRAYAAPFALHKANLIYQVYDREVASRVKLALLEFYPPKHEVRIAGESGTRVVPLSELDWPAQHFDHLTSVLVGPLDREFHPHDFAALLNIMARLREPDLGCPWDREQTPEKLRRYLVEETYEVLDAIDSGDPDKYAEELGDLLLQVVFHSQLAREDSLFTIDDVIGHIVAKLIRRHPHVFGNVDVADADEVLRNWEVIKRGEKGYEDRKSILDGVVRNLPGLMRAQEISKRAAKAGFEWDSIEGVFDKLSEEVAELREAREGGDRERIAEEIGDLLFTAVNLARFDKVDAEDALQRMVNRFIARFKRIEQVAESRGVSVDHLTQTEMEAIWQQAKLQDGGKLS
ncbi:MAG: nucleoside triphosphate pyrophosphohydrolase [Capsulimonadaceae bacterium]|nr:nucleoside triphosphate pyrophosphohydrolase [Capsulimonadaceae bacterium]